MGSLITAPRNFWLVVAAVVSAALLGLGVSLLADRPGHLFVTAVIAGGALSAATAARLALPSLAGLGRRLRWWHLLWCLLFLSSLVFRVRTFADVNSNPFDFWSLYRAGLVGVVGVVLLGLESVGRLRFLPSLFRGLLGLLAAYALFSLVSTAWSVHRPWTLYKSLEYLVDVSLLAAILDRVRSAQAFKALFDWTWTLLWAMAASVWLGLFIWPGAVTRSVGNLGLQIQGVLPAISANGVGELGAVLGVVSLVRLLDRGPNRHLHVVLFTVAMATLILAQSRSPLAGFLLAVPIILFATRRVGVIMFISLALPAVLLLTRAGEILWRYVLRDQGTALFLSLSGRTDWWELAMASFSARPLVGLGAYAGTQFAVMSQVSREIASIHSTWVQALVDTGILGALLLTLVVGGAWVIGLKTLRRLDRTGIEHRLLTEALAVLAVLTVRSVFTSTFIWHPSLPFLLVLGYIEYLRRQAGRTHHENPAGS